MIAFKNVYEKIWWFTGPKSKMFCCMGIRDERNQFAQNLCTDSKQVQMFTYKYKNRTSEIDAKVVVFKSA